MKNKTTKRDMRKTKRSHKILAIFLNVIMLNALLPYNILYANNNGPNSPEAAGFEPVDATDMVSLSTGDLSYVLPLLDVEGYPVNLSYHAGITTDLDASWVGLGWYLTPGAINRSVTNTPDDVKNGIGVDFNSYSHSETYYSVSASLDFAIASAGVGMNWGGGQGLSGSVMASAGLGLFKNANGDSVLGAGVGARADTRGNVSVGLQLGVSINDEVSAGISASYSFNSQKMSYGLGVSQKTGNTPTSNSYTNSSTSLGIGFDGNGVTGISAGSNFTNGQGKGTSGGATFSSSTISQGDISQSQQTSGISIPLHFTGLPITLGFNKTKVKINIRKGYEHHNYGALYSNDHIPLTSSSVTGNSPIIYNVNNNTGFNDYVNRATSLDTYSTPIPQSEEEFIGDYSKQIEKVNFDFIGYDDYNITAQGLMGSITPNLFENAIIAGKGVRTTNADKKDIHVYWHAGFTGLGSFTDSWGTKHAPQNALPNKTLEGYKYDSGGYPAIFYFNGQFTQNEKNGTVGLNNTTGNDLSDFINKGAHSGYTASNGRAKSPNYIQVYTNEQIESGFAKANGLVTPSNIDDNTRTDTALFDPTGIGGYKITAPDGKTYHYALPVYHYEQVHRNLINNQESVDFDANNVQEKREFSRYATHWLLTAITGPDYVDRPDPINNELGTFNKEDYGYWVELEYGKWSDGFVWRDPYKDLTYNYNTNLLDEIEDKDKGGYTFGRKQLYYLDKINTRNKTALFVKDIRYDAIGKDLKFKFFNGGNLGIGSSGTNSTNSLNYTDPTIEVGEVNGVSYAREYSLRLKRIVLVSSEAGKDLSKTSQGTLGSEYSKNASTTYVKNGLHSPNWESKYFEQVYGANYSYAIQQESQVLDVNDVSNDFIRDNALKVIDFDQDYTLAKNSSSSAVAPYKENPELGNKNRGKLTLNAVRFKDRNLKEYMPPTRFDYYFKEMSNLSPSKNYAGNSPTASQIKEHIKDKRDFSDNWGFMQGNYSGNDGSGNAVKAWSLKSIEMPTGARIDIDYEEDDYWIEAFGRRVFNNNSALMYDIKCADVYGNPINFPGGYSNKPSNPILIEVRNSYDNSNYVGWENIDFTQYFSTDNELYLDLTVCYRAQYGGDRRSRGLHLDDVKGEVLEVGLNYCKILVPGNSSYWFEADDWEAGRVSGKWWSRRKAFNYQGGILDIDMDTNKFERECPDFPQGDENANFSVKLIANKVPENETGGGLRVSQLRTTDGLTTYKTTYDYNDPFHQRTSGITSYAPVDGLKFVPYQSEIPAPGVMYEYVTMKTSGNDENDYTSMTRYRHHVLNPVFNIFNPDITMNTITDDVNTEDKIFQAKVINNYGGYNGNGSQKILAKSIDVNINTAILGQIKSIENYNSLGQLMMKTEHEYVNGDILTGNKNYKTDPYNRNGQGLFSEPNKGITKETFNTMKTIFQTNSDGTIIENTKRLLSVSSKTKYNNMLRRSTIYSGGVETSQEFSDVDPWLGSFRKTITKLADGTQLTTEKVPAYEKYAAMGSKVLSSGNANMLSQEAFSITTANINGTDKTLNASLTTWKNNWNYSNLDYTAFDSNAGPGVWRKQAQYIWKDAIDSEHGNYVSTLSASQDNFNWSANAPSSSKWQKVSETTRYNHWSSPLEVRDINGNFASTIMVDNDSKVGAVVNSRASASYADGSEYINNSSASYLLKNQITPLRDNKAHTGLYSYKTQSNGETVYSLSTSSGTSQTDLSKALQPGTYKISFWHKPSIGLTSNPSLLPQVIFNGNTIQPSEQVDAACWRLMNYYIEVGVNQNVSVQVKQNGSGAINFDDFRLHPAESSMTTYVYDHLGYLTHINGSNNLSTAYVYDDAGNLKAIYNEIQNMYQDGSKVMVDPKDDDSIIGGFILKSSYRRNFKGHTYQYDEPVKVLDNCSSTQIPSNYQPGYYL